MMASADGAGGNDANCITLLHFDNNATNSSSISQTWTENQYVLYSSSIKKFGTYAMYDQYGVSKADPNPDGDIVNNSGIFYNYLTGDWTAECWFRIPGINGNKYSYLFSIQTTSGSYPYFSMAIKNTSVQLYHSTSGTNLDFSQEYEIDIASATWHHCAVVKKDGTVTVYINGIAEVTGVPWMYTPNAAWTRSSVGDYNMGYIDEFRFSNKARWTSNFTPPTAPY